MQYNDTRELVQTFMAKYLPRHQLPQKPTQIIPFSVDGAGSLEAGRIVVEHGRTMLQQKEDGNRYTTIATDYALQNPHRLEIKKEPRKDFKQAIGHQLFQIVVDELLGEVVAGIKEYLADKSPVSTVYESDFYQEYPSRLLSKRTGWRLESRNGHKRQTV